MKRFILIIAIALASLYVVWPQQPGNYIPGGDILPGSTGIHIGGFDRQGARLGLDLQGGTQLTLLADMSNVPAEQQAESLKGLLNVIERRVNAYGVAEPEIQSQGTDRVIVQLPGIRDIEEAKQLIGQTAELEFKRLDAGGNWVPATATINGQEVALTGKYLVPGRQQLTFAGGGGAPQVYFEFNDEGAQLFSQISSRLIGQRLGIFLDGQLVSDPVVQTQLGSNGVITGLTLEQGRLLALQLNAGALPVPVSIVEERTVDATLGADSVRKSIVAGELALLIVILFMILYYRLPGVAASAALIVYSLVTLAIFKLVPVTLTLAGVAGFILSLGMAVDANILIFERMREELRSGKTLVSALEAGEARAWPSIRDSNSSTLITCAVLYGFGSAFGATIIMGFSIVLAIGVIVSLFSAIFVSRTLLEVLLTRRWAQSSRLFGMEVPPPTASQPLRRSAATAGSRG